MRLPNLLVSDIFATFVPEYSGGPVPDSHGVPFSSFRILKNVYCVKTSLLKRFKILLSSIKKLLGCAEQPAPPAPNPLATHFLQGDDVDICPYARANSPQPNLFLGFGSLDISLLTLNIAVRLPACPWFASPIQNIRLPNVSRCTMSATALRGGPAFGSTAGRPMGMTATASYPSGRAINFLQAS